VGNRLTYGYDDATTDRIARCRNPDRLGFASIAAGVIARRRPVVRLLERMQADARAVKRMRRLRAEFGSGPMELALPGRRMVVVLDPDDVGRVLAEAPAPFHPASLEKRKALQWFQPHGVLISSGRIRDRRRILNEAVLDTGSAVHRLADSFAAVIADEARGVVADATAHGQLDSAQFMTAWWRVVRRLALGDRGRDDETIIDQLLRLRKAGNWSFLSLPHYRMRDAYPRHQSNRAPASVQYSKRYQQSSDKPTDPIDSALKSNSLHEDRQEHFHDPNCHPGDEKDVGR
jgi:hypothetical protein